MPDERSAVITVPTELDRHSPFYDLAALGMTVVIVRWLSQFGLQWYALPLVLVVAAWTLSGEPATDVPFIGMIASGIRNKLGLRRAHEWVLAYVHYVNVAVVPRSREQWQNSRLRSRIQTSTTLQRLRSASGAIRISKPQRFSSRP
jgi:hypothetical protein